MATSDIKTTAGAGVNIATYSTTEDAETKQIQRNVINNSSGTEIGTSSNPIQVTLANTGANSTAVKVDGSGVTLTASVAGDVSHGTTDSGKPVKVGARAIASPSAGSNVTDGQRTDNIADLDGAHIIRPNATLGDLTSGTAQVATVTSTSVIPSAGAGVKVYLTGCIIANSSNTTNTIVNILDGSTIKAILPVPSNGGVVHAFGTPIGGTAATAWSIQALTAATMIYVTLTGFKSKI